MPRTAILYIAQNCNQQCVFCLEEDGGWNEFVDPSTREVDAEISRLYERGARHITFMGGETFFRKDLPRIIAGAKARGFTRIGVTTNGTVLSKHGFIKRLVDAGLEFIEMSVHGHTRELANAISRADVTFDRQAQALAEIQAAGLPTILNVVICRENKDHLIDVARYVHEGFPRIPIRFKFKFVSLQGWEAERAEGAQPLAYDEVDFIAVGDYLRDVGVPYWFYNVPLCRLGEHAHHALELASLAGDETYFDLDHRGRIEYYDSGSQFEGRVWPRETCGACSLIALCPGVEETHRRARGEVPLSPRSDDACAVLVRTFQDRGIDPAYAPARLAELGKQPRPARFTRNRPEGALRFRHPDEAEALDIIVEPRELETRGFRLTPHFALSYRPWVETDPYQLPNVQALLEAVAEALEQLDARGAALDEARAELARLTTSGWVFDPESELSPRRPKAVHPVLIRSLRPPPERAAQEPAE